MNKNNQVLCLESSTGQKNILPLSYKRNTRQVYTTKTALLTELAKCIFLSHRLQSYKSCTNNRIGVGSTPSLCTKGHGSKSRTEEKISWLRFFAVNEIGSCSDKSSFLEIILSLFNPFYILKPIFLKLISILHFHLRLCLGSDWFPRCVYTKILYAFFFCHPNHNSNPLLDPWCKLYNMRRNIN
jgi:hypothetical protein